MSLTPTAVAQHNHAHCLKHSHVVGASVFGGTDGETTGYRGDNLTGTNSFAELGMGTFLGGLGYKARRWFIYAGHYVRGFKRDIGLGGGYVFGHRRDVDLWIDLARKLHFPYGVALIRITKARCA